MKKQRALVVCPGRGTYVKDTLGYLARYGVRSHAFLTDVDERRRARGEPTVTELDHADRFDPDVHTRGENASTLIYACARVDFDAIDRDRFEIVAITGNSMGWYLSLAYGGALSPAGAFDVIDTMGGMMRERIVGGQMIYPVCDEEWRPDPAKRARVTAALLEIPNLHPSIDLGGYLVVGGNEDALAELKRRLPPVEIYPLRLVNHAAFHTPLLRDTSARGLASLPPELFAKPDVPLIDGRGHVWTPGGTDPGLLREYTLGHQVTEPYDFAAAVRVGLKEFAPDVVIVLGPGGSLGGSVGQIMVEMNWRGLDGKASFTRAQAEDPVVIAMGRPDQRKLVHLSVAHAAGETP